MSNIGTGHVNYHRSPPLEASRLPTRTASPTSEMAAMVEDIMSSTPEKTGIPLPDLGRFRHQATTLDNGMVVGPNPSRIEPLSIQVSQETFYNGNFQTALQAVANNGIQVAVAVGASGMSDNALLGQVKEGLEQAGDKHTMDSIYGYIQNHAADSRNPQYSHPARMGGD